jgi:preprotein translocase subunit YajC
MHQLDEYLILGQQNPPLFFEGEEGGGAEATTQEQGGEQPLGPSGGFGGNFILIVFGMVAFLLIFSMWGQRKDRKKRDAMLSQIKKHDKVQTLGGIVGSIIEVKKDTVVLKVDESSNTRITFARSAIQTVLTSTEEPAPVKEEKI